MTENGKSSPAEFLSLVTTISGRRKNVQIRYEDGDIWLSQKMMSQIFKVDVSTINYHIKNIFKTSELFEEPTIRKFEIVQKEGDRDVMRNVEHYNSQMAITIGYRVNSSAAIHFRKWVNFILKNHGFIEAAEDLPNPPIKKPKVAIVHYWLVNMRGGEKALESLLDIYPEADVFTNVYDPKAISEKINSRKISTTYINKLPFAKKMYQKYMPLMPNALKELDLSEYDLVISSESGPAKGVVVSPNAYHICYCHTPMRYCWDMYHEYFAKSGFLTRFFMKRLIPFLRQWDISSSNLVDRFVTNSNYVAKRINRYYNRPADVVFGPTDVEKFINVQRDPQDFYLFFGQLVGYKRVDLAIEACIQSGRKLVVAGEGDKKIRKKYSNFPEIQFLGRVSEEKLLELFSKARALIFPGVEDLGLVPIEANAAGVPVIAYNEGGVTDTIKDGETGILFNEQTAEDLIGALDLFESLPPTTFSDRKVFTEHVKQFSKEEFQKRIEKIVSERVRK